MSWKRRAGGGKRDSAEKAIVNALRAIGARCWFIGGTGNPDVLVLYRGRYVPLEVKTGKGRVTDNQDDIPWPIVRTVDEALSKLTE